MVPLHATTPLACPVFRCNIGPSPQPDANRWFLPQMTLITSVSRRVSRPGLVALFHLSIASRAAAQCAAPDVVAPAVSAWSDKVIAAILSRDACYADKSAFTNSDCNIFVGRVLEQAYGVTDFVNDDGGTSADGVLRYHVSGEVALMLWTTLTDRWELLGGMQEQASLAKAQQRAFEGKPVIAVWRNPAPGRPGHVALVGPGPLTRSNAHRLDTPVSASFFQGQPHKNYVGKPLACAFTPAQAPSVRLYARR